MKKILLIIHFIFLSINLSFGQLLTCEVKSICENDLLKNEELIDFFETNINNNVQDSWYSLYLANEVEKRIDNIALTDISNHLKSTSKSAEDLSKEIKDIGGYTNWKALADAGSGLLTKLDNLGLSSLTTKLDDLTSVQKTKFLDEFADASDDALKQLNNNGAELLDTWRNVSHLTQFTNNVDFLQWLSKAKQSHLPIHLVGEVNSSGRAVGCHLLEALDGVKVKISNEALTIKNSAGDIVRAKIEILDPSTAGFVEKGALSTFFPKSWDKSRALEEVAGILVNPSNQVNSRKFVGLSSDGVTRIEVRLTGPNGNLVFDTAFPLN